MEEDGTQRRKLLLLGHAMRMVNNSAPDWLHNVLTSANKVDGVHTRSVSTGMVTPGFPAPVHIYDADDAVVDMVKMSTCITPPQTLTNNFSNVVDLLLTRYDLLTKLVSGEKTGDDLIDVNNRFYGKDGRWELDTLVQSLDLLHQRMHVVCEDTEDATDRNAENKELLQLLGLPCATTTYDVARTINKRFTKINPHRQSTPSIHITAPS